MFTRSARFYDAIYSFLDYEGDAALLHTMIQARVPGAATLLDVACGTGLHLHHLTHHYTAEGLDLDATMLLIARERCPDVPFHEGDMADFDLGRTFDAVLCMFSAIAYTKTTERLRQRRRFLLSGWHVPWKKHGPRGRSHHNELRTTDYGPWNYTSPNSNTSKTVGMMR